MKPEIQYNLVQAIRISLIALVLWSSYGSAHGQPTNRNLRVAFFYKVAAVADPTNDPVLIKTTTLLNPDSHVQVEPFAYRDSHEFCDLYDKQISHSSNYFDLILGPSDSQSLKALDNALPRKQPLVFLAPFVTTSPEEYSHIQLITGSPTDARRVTVAVTGFLQYTALRTLGCLHTDGPWGNGIAKNLRTALASVKTLVLPQPVVESVFSETNGFSVHQDSTSTYRTFLEMTRKQGVTVIVVALLENESLNEFFGALKTLNDSLLVEYKPSILLLNPPTFDSANKASGILTEYVARFSIFYVDGFLNPAVDAADKGLAPHLDACKVVAAAVHDYPLVDGAGEPVTAVQIRAFYAGSYRGEQGTNLQATLTTGFHLAKLHLNKPDVEVMKAENHRGVIQTKPVGDYFGGGYFQKMWYGGVFFVRHHRTLWNPITSSLFLACCLGSLLYMVRYKAMRGWWLILKTKAFWLLFTVNLVITYTVWVLSIAWGVFDDSNLLAALLLAGVCPTAASALGDLAKRFLPIDLTGVIRVIEELNERLINQIDNSKLEEYREKLRRINVDELKRKFFEVLVLDIDSDSLRNRLREQLQKKIEQITQAHSGEVAKDSLARVYAFHLVQLLAYLSSSKDDLEKRVHQTIDEPDLPGGAVA